MSARGRLAASGLLISLTTAGALAAPQPAATPGLSHPERLRPIYDAILDADYVEAERLIARDCAPAPGEACLVLAAVLVGWQIQLDPDSRALDSLFTNRLEKAIAAVDSWTEREPERAEAWFYLGGAYGARAQWHVLRRDRLAAARDGNHARRSLEQALALDPQMSDAFFGIGLYHYYAAVAPTIARMVRWLLLLPGGNREQGLREMLETRERGALLAGEADYQLHLIYLWYENSPARAKELLAGLHERYPRNPIFPFRLAFIEDAYLHDHPASLAGYRALLDSALDGRVNLAPSAEARARLGVATELDHLYETDAAVDQLRRIMAARPASPFGAVARASFAFGLAQDRLGSRQTAVASYRSALEFARRHGLQDLADEARAALRRPAPRAAAAEAYRLSLQGWRLLQRGDPGAAEPLLQRARQLDPADPVVELRLAKLLLARGAAAEARSGFDRVIRAGPAAPAPFRAEAFLELGRLDESERRLQAAVAMYQAAARISGAGAETREAAERALDRLRRGDATAPRAN